MLQRAASNAYSWWWASHIRTKQSKWLEQSLQDMEERVQRMLTLIEEDGDSFAKRAEMYYKRRPELISFVEEVYKSFRALADRYDLLSKELQNANHTIATVFPEQVQFGIGEEEDHTTKDPKSSPVPGKNASSNVPQVPKAPNIDLKRIMSAASKQLNNNKSSKAQNPNKTEVKSGLIKDEALEEINKLQKDILALQTVKEFVKSSYESGVAKYWELDNQIVEMQRRVSRLQDEFNIGAVIEDDEARTLMAEAALRSCQETLAMLQEKQEKSGREAGEEYKRIEAACQRLQSLRQKYLFDEERPIEGDENPEVGDKSRSSSKDADSVTQETKEIGSLPEKTEETLDLSNVSCLTVTQMAEKIDQLVNKVISLETSVSSQTALVNTLRAETDDLNDQIRNLEDEKENLVDDTNNLSTRVKEMEEKLNKIQDLNKNVESQHGDLQTNFAEARSNLDHLSEKLSSVKPDEEQDEIDASHDEASLHSQDKLEEELNNQKDASSLDESGKSYASTSEAEDKEDVKEVDIHVGGSDPSVLKQEQVKKEIRKSVSLILEWKPREQTPKNNLNDPANAEEQGHREPDKEPNWQQMLLSGVEDREKILLKEYTEILRNYKDIKKKLNDKEKKERDSQFDTTLQIRELKKAILKRDEEIQHLRQQLNYQQGDKDAKEDITPQSNSLATKEVPDANEDANHVPTADEGDKIKLIFIDRIPSLSKAEAKLRTDIDAILDENLDFWLRFSTAFHQVQKFRTEVVDLQDETSKLREKRELDGSSATQINSEVRAIYKHLREIQTELTVWLDQSVSLKDELKSRFASLCRIQEEITLALREGAEEDEIVFSSHQAAKFQGEILNMKQENNKVREELQAGLDHVRILQLEIEKTLRQLNEDFGIASEQPENLSRSRVPLRSFIFGSKKKQKHSILSCMHPGRRYQVFKGGLRMTNH